MLTKENTSAVADIRKLLQAECECESEGKCLPGSNEINLSKNLLTKFSQIIIT